NKDSRAAAPPAVFTSFIFSSGKIRVFCRIRPLNRAEATQGGAIVVEKMDEYSVNLETPRGQREFQFDKVFNAETTQEEIFQDTNRSGLHCSLISDRCVHKLHS
uniref:Kinesin motor domain-containing protein n=1 Tax=Myripristis murdjan TaxID=586833 RepID=A0A667XH45_9TELE